VSGFEGRAAEVDANLQRAAALMDEVRHNIDLAEGLLDTLIPDPWFWQRGFNARTRREVQRLINQNRIHQAEVTMLQMRNTVLLLQNVLDRR
jgi:hypothetical protein